MGMWSLGLPQQLWTTTTVLFVDLFNNIFLNYKFTYQRQRDDV